MQYPLTEDERMIQKTVRDFARKELAPVAIEANEKGIFPEGIFKRLGELGFMGVTVPEEYGGVDLGTFSLVLILEEINAVCASTGVTMSVHNSLTNWCILKYGSEKIRRRFLPSLASGEMLGAYAITESEAGSDVSAMRLSAVRTGDEYILNGAKLFISTGDQAGAIVVFARTDPADRTKGISAFVVEPSSPGFSIGKIEKKMGLNASTTVELVFEDCRVSADNLLGSEGMGMKIALAGLDGGRIGIAAQAVGIARRALEESVAYSKQRMAFGKPISEFQAIQHELARMDMELECARLAVYNAARLKEAGLPFAREGAIAKLKSSEVAEYCTSKGLELLGGYGYVKEYPLEKMYRDAKIGKIYEGTSNMQLATIAKLLLK